MWIIVFAIIILAILIGITMLKVMHRQAFENHILEHKVIIKKLPSAFQNFRLFFISDIHQREVENTLLEQLPEAPDIIIIGGDLAEEGVPFSRIEKNLKILAALGPLYFVWGNHDLFLDEERLRDLLKKYNVTLLENETVQLTRDQTILNLSGVHDATNELDDLEKTYRTMKPGPTILISHNPVIKRKLRDPYTPELVISGHTHGGQVRLLGMGIRERGGIKQHKFGQLLISNGYGTTRFPIRWGAKPDAMFITLESNDGAYEKAK